MSECPTRHCFQCSLKRPLTVLFNFSGGQYMVRNVTHSMLCFLAQLSMRLFTNESCWLTHFFLGWLAFEGLGYCFRFLCLCTGPFQHCALFQPSSVCFPYGKHMVSWPWWVCGSDIWPVWLYFLSIFIFQPVSWLLPWSLVLSTDCFFPFAHSFYGMFSFPRWILSSL